MTGAVFPLVPSRRVVGLAFGGMRSARRGRGSDVAGSRPYRPGDDVASIDWAASARLSSARGLDEFIVRERFAEESPRVVLVADLGPTMAIGPPPRGRYRKAVALEAASRLIADSAKAAHGAVGSLDYGDSRPNWRRPRSGAAASPDEERSFGAPDGSISSALDFLAQQRRDLPAGTFVFVVSDFLIAPSREDWQLALGHRWDVVPVVIQDPLWERAFPDVSGVVVPLTEPRTGAVREVRLTAREAQGRHHANQERWKRLLDDFRSVGLIPVVLDSDEPAEIAAAFFRWADDRLYVRGRG